MKPIVKWAGGKRQLLEQLSPSIPLSCLYVEPFVGGGAVWLHAHPQHAIINDSNPELINVYKVVRDSPDELIALLREHEAADSSKHFYEVRAWDRDPSVFAKLSSVERAARTVYLNKTCYGGIWRVNKKGQMNTAYNPRRRQRYIVNETSIRALHDYLAGNDIDIRCGDYADTLAELPEDSFVYLDPPYMPAGKTESFTRYTADCFDYKEQVRLRDWCVRLRAKGIPFIESNSDTPAVRELYKDFIIRTIPARRSINSHSGKRGPVSEVLITW